MSTYLHIGYPKAASTWIRYRFLPCVSNIKLYNNKQIRDAFLLPAAFDFNSDTLREHFVIERGEDTWISAELLTNKVKTGGNGGFVSKELANRLKSVFPDAKIVFIIRNQLDILASAYLQYIKGGGNYSVKKFLFPEKFAGLRASGTSIFRPEFFCYDKAINYYAQLFGRENVHVFLYEELVCNSQKFIADFSIRFDLHPDKNEIDFSPVNRAYRRALILPRKFANCFTRCGPLNKYYLVHVPAWNRVNRKLFDFANRYRIFGKKPDSLNIIGRKNWKTLEDYYRSSNRKLMNSFGIREMKKYNYPL